MFLNNANKEEKKSQLSHQSAGGGAISNLHFADDMYLVGGFNRELTALQTD